MIESFATVAVEAVYAYKRSDVRNPREAWLAATQKVFPYSVSMQEKGCPRTTFLTLCASGAVTGIPAGPYVKDSANVKHALDALALLKTVEGAALYDARRLWDRVTHGSGKAYNQQMHVVLGLAKAGFLHGVEVPRP
jgi:hypothetical protein